MRFSRSNTGLALAILAATFTFRALHVASCTQAREFSAAPWSIVALLTGLGFLASAIIADRWLFVAKALLVIGALVRIGTGMYLGR